MSDVPGRTIAGYQIVELIDDAARALVYKGQRPGENRTVAVKVLKPAVATDPSVAQSFAHYAQLAARMQHPNILPVLESGQDGGAHYLVVPFMGHRSVAQHRSAYRDLYQAEALLAGIVSGLEFLYAQGYVHGNLRPTNILLDDQWRPLLADFGMAMRQGEAATPYNSPEQVRGGVVDRRTDVYALGVILYELLSGRPPAPGMMFTLSPARPDLPPAVEQAVLRATAQNPDQRFQNARDLLNALQVATSAVTAAPAPAPQSISQTVHVQQPRRGFPWLGLLFGGLALIVCLVVAAPMVRDALNPPTQVIPPQAGETVAPPVDAPPTQEPPVTEQPIEPAETPTNGGGGIQLPAACSSLGVAGGIVLTSGALTRRQRRRGRGD